MNEQARTALIPADEAPARRLLRDFPVVFLSFDEPLADQNWMALKRLVPGAARVHGVTGLDACHKAAAAAVPGDWVVTVDADTRLLPGAERIAVPEDVLNDITRLDWLSRNSVNGLWSGNGCLKLWPKRLLREMRTHEAAAADDVSLDHGIGDVVPGKSGQLTLPERASETNPAATPGHAFRAGFREAVFLHHMAAEDAARQGLDDWRLGETARLLRVWASVGRHAPNGVWMIYGARLGLLWPELEPGWDARSVNDYGWLDALWSRRVAPRFGGAGDGGWRWDWLDSDLRALGARLADDLGFLVAELSGTVSQVVAEEAPLSPVAAASRYDARGYRQMMAAKTSEDVARPRRYLDVARWLDHPSAYHNVGMALMRGPDARARRADTAWQFHAALALGNPFSRKHLDDLERDGAVDLAARPAVPLAAYTDAPQAGFALETAASVTPGPGAERHVPDPALCPEGHVLGYAARCALTGRIVPDALFFGRAADLAAASPRRVISLPVVVGVRGLPETAAQARAFGAADAAAGLVSDGLATLGRHESHGAAYVEAVLAARVGASGGIGDTAENLADAIGRNVPDIAPDVSRLIVALLPEVAPEALWYDAAAGLAETEASDALRRTARAVWGARS